MKHCLKATELSHLLLSLLQSSCDSVQNSLAEIQCQELKEITFLVLLTSTCPQIQDTATLPSCNKELLWQVTNLKDTVQASVLHQGTSHLTTKTSILLLFYIRYCIQLKFHFTLAILYSWESSKTEEMMLGRQEKVIHRRLKFCRLPL